MSESTHVRGTQGGHLSALCLTQQQRRVTGSASRYIQENDFYDSDCRFDMFGITVDRGLFFIKHLEHTSTGIMQ